MTCVCKVDKMVEDGMIESKYIETSDNTCNFNQFQDFLYCHLYKCKNYEAMHPHSNQPGCFFLLQLKLIRLNPLKTFLWKVSYDK